MTLGSANREMNMTAGEVLFLERAGRIINSKQTTTNFLFSNLLFFWAHTNQAPKSTAAVSTVRTAGTAEPPSIGSAQSSNVPTVVVRSGRPECDNAACRHERASQVLPRASHVRVLYGVPGMFLSFLFLLVTLLFLFCFHARKKLRVTINLDI